MDDKPLDHLKEQLSSRYEHLEESKRLGIPVTATKRFFEIEGLDLGGLLALELFTTIIPLILIGFSWATDFNAHLSFGDFMIRWLDLRGQSAVIVRELFGTTASLRSSWTVVGLAGFLFWGIPMSSQVAKTFARAFRRERWPFWTEVWRGTLWFLVLLVSQILTVVATTGHAHDITTIFWNLVGWIPSFILWSVSPLILVRNGTNGWKHMAWCGLVGVVLDVICVRITMRFIFPRLLEGWVGFGPIGVAMAIMTTCTIIAALWVITACLGAVLWERNAPPEMVIALQHEPRIVDPATRRH
jgi:uncharacterized BrkB/YihY/UPF0761 family membrane protein